MLPEFMNLLRKFYFMRAVARNAIRQSDFFDRLQLVEKVRFGLMPRRAFAFPKEKIAAPKENPLKELLCVSSPERDFFSSISR